MDGCSMTGTIYMMLGGILSIASISIYVYLIYRFQKRKKEIKERWDL